MSYIYPVSNLKSILVPSINLETSSAEAKLLPRSPYNKSQFPSDSKPTFFSYHIFLKLDKIPAFPHPILLTHFITLCVCGKLLSPQ